MPRLRIQYRTWPRRGLVLTDTPRPNCWACDGDGGHLRDYGHPETGEYEGTDWEPCPCWDEENCRLLLPLPRIPRCPSGTGRDPWSLNGHSDEPPF